MSTSPVAASAYTPPRASPLTVNAGSRFNPLKASTLATSSEAVPIGVRLPGVVGPADPLQAVVGVVAVARAVGERHGQAGLEVLDAVEGVDQRLPVDRLTADPLDRLDEDLGGDPVALGVHVEGGDLAGEVLLH